MNVWVYIGQMVEHCNANSEAMGSNPVKVPIFFPVYLQIAKNLITTATIISSFKKNCSYHLHSKKRNNFKKFSFRFLAVVPSHDQKYGPAK